MSPAPHLAISHLADRSSSSRPLTLVGWPNIPAPASHQAITRVGHQAADPRRRRSHLPRFVKLRHSLPRARASPLSYHAAHPSCPPAHARDHQAFRVRVSASSAGWVRRSTAFRLLSLIKIVSNRHHADDQSDRAGGATRLHCGGDGWRADPSRPCARL